MSMLHRAAHSFLAAKNRRNRETKLTEMKFNAGEPRNEDLEIEESADRKGKKRLRKVKKGERDPANDLASVAT